MEHRDGKNCMLIVLISLVKLLCSWETLLLFANFLHSPERCKSLCVCKRVSKSFARQFKATRGDEKIWGKYILCFRVLSQMFCGPRGKNRLCDQTQSFLGITKVLRRKGAPKGIWWRKLNSLAITWKFCEQMQSFSGARKHFAIECKVSLGNTELLQEGTKALFHPQKFNSVINYSLTIPNL